MNLRDIRKKHRVIDLFVDLAEIPSPSFKEKEVADTISEILSIHGVENRFDSYGNIIAKIPATSGCNNVEPVLLSAHMDVVGGSDRVNVLLNGNYIETDKKRTLGADDKAGVAEIIDVAIEMADLYSKTPHGPIEITFTRDEEHSMTGMENLDTSKLSSKYALILDGESLGVIDHSGAGYTNIFIKVHGGKGGHSGIDIADTTRVSALKVLAEVDACIPQGVYKQDDSGVITSVNAASFVGGSAGMYLGEKIKDLFIDKVKSVPDELKTENIMHSTARNSMTNIIAQEAYSVYSLRSSDPKVEKELVDKIKRDIDKLVAKYERRIKIEVIVKKHLKPFVKSDDSLLRDVVVDAANLSQIDYKLSSFHAGAETHLLSNDKVNAKGEKFLPLLLGVANIYNMHSCNESLDWQSLVRGREWVKNIILEFAKHNEKR
ncbi:MAG: M20/M25/M40 family metallo-hydrolase [Candidatus Gastranaerophilales bacterium]|nr:M20/M25/M40 family metallo-hydrolase [Candidatus Gastranaerophilales bacterium]